MQYLTTIVASRDGSKKKHFFFLFLHSGYGNFDHTFAEKKSVMSLTPIAPDRFWRSCLVMPGIARRALGESYLCELIYSFQTSDAIQLPS
jgi:hypothetical protein